MDMTTTRRNFVAGAAAVTVGTIAVSGAPTALAEEAAEAAAEQPLPTFDIHGTADAAGDIGCICDDIETDAEGMWTGQTWSWTVPPAVPSADEVSEEADCEILIMGLGSAGVPALVYAAAMGADVIGVTAGAFPEAEGAYCAAYNTPMDAENGVENVEG